MSVLKYDHLKQIMKENIRNGLWQPGDKIPLEQDLCTQFEVSRMTVKRAKNDLIAEGLLENLPGRRGVFVKDSPVMPATTDFIGVALDDIKDPFVAEMLQGIEGKLWEDGLHTILCNAYFDFTRIEAYFHSLLQKQAAGVIFTPIKGPGYV